MRRFGGGNSLGRGRYRRGGTGNATPSKSVAAGKGNAVKASPVTVAIDQDKEIVEELEEKDIKLYGVGGVPRSLMNLVCSTSVYGSIRNALDKMARSNIDTAAEEFYAWHGGAAIPACICLPGVITS